MPKSAKNRMVYLQSGDNPRCFEASDLVSIPAEFMAATSKLSRDLRLALDCFLVFGGVPRPIAIEIQLGFDPVQCGIDMAVKGQTLQPGKAGN